MEDNESKLASPENGSEPQMEFSEKKKKKKMVKIDEDREALEMKDIKEALPEIGKTEDALDLEDKKSKMPSLENGSTPEMEFFGKKKKKKKIVNIDQESNEVSEPLQMKDVTGALPEIGKTEGCLDLEDNKSKMASVQKESKPEMEFFGKKKKKKTVNIDEGSNEVFEPSQMKDSKESFPVLDEIGDALDLETFGDKKKRKKKRGGPAGVDNDPKEIEEDGVTNTWDNSDRDYTYDELLQRAFGIMREKNPEMMAGEKKKFVMRPPQVMRAGTKKTAFVNFSEIASVLHRQPKHLLSFISAELGTVGAIDGTNQLIMKGRFQQKHIEHVLRRYIKEYVTCHTCKSPDTILEKEDRLFFLKCMTCHSRCSVQTVKTGFQAVTSKRAAMRAKE